MDGKFGNDEICSDVFFWDEWHIYFMYICLYIVHSSPYLVAMIR